MPDNAVLCCNRAMAHLKADNFKSAEVDCTKCLELDSSQIKAWYRRGLARKALRKYHSSLSDFEMTLQLDSKNKAAQKEKIWTKRKLDAMLKKSQKQTFGTSKKKQTTKENKMRKNVIEECDDDSDSDLHARML